MIEILNECYRHGLDVRESFRLEDLDFYENSFVAFQIVITLEEAAVISLADTFEYSPQNLPNYELKAPGEIFFVKPVNTERGLMWDRLAKESFYAAKAHEDVVLLVYLEKYFPEIEVCLWRRERNRAAVLKEACAIKCFHRGKINLSRRYIQLWQHPTTVARHYKVKPYSEKHFDILDGYLKALGEIGLCSITAVLSDAPWNGQIPLLKGKYISNIFENNMLRVERNPLSIDFSALDKYIDMCRKHNIGPEIDIFGLIGVWERDFPEISTTTGDLQGNEIDAYIDAVYSHFVEKGYAENSFLCIDEPKDVNKLIEQLQYIKKHCPMFKIKCTFDNEAVFAEMKDEVDRSILSFFRACQMEGGADSFYVCCGPEEPNSFTSSRLIEIRSLAYIAKKLNIPYFLRWACIAFTDAPNEESRFGEFRGGDTYFLYPSDNGGVSISLRHLQFRRLWEEFSLLENAADKYKEAFNIASLKDVIIDDSTVTPDFIKTDYEIYRKLRAEFVKISESCSKK